MTEFLAQTHGRLGLKRVLGLKRPVGLGLRPLPVFGRNTSVGEKLTVVVWLWADTISLTDRPRYAYSKTVVTFSLPSVTMCIFALRGMHIRSMASINIYVTDALKERMGQVEANWSEVCRRAIEAELTRLANGSGQPSELATTETADWKQLVFDTPLVDQGVVLKVAPGNPPVVLLADWLERVNQQIGTMSINGGSFGQLLGGTFPTGLLIPGRPWLSGSLKVEQRLVFSYPPSEESVS